MNQEKAEGGESWFAGVKAGVKKALVAFVIVDVILLVGGVALYFAIFRPQLTKLAEARDHAGRASQAFVVRLRGVEVRYSLARGDLPGAQAAVADMKRRLEDLKRAVPKKEEREAAGVNEALERTALVENEVARDPATAARDLEIVDARLDALYPAVAGTTAPAPPNP